LNKIPPEEMERIKTNENMQYQRPSDYPLLALNRVQWNPNRESYTWLLTAGQSGLCRISCLSGLRPSWCLFTSLRKSLELLVKRLDLFDVYRKFYIQILKELQSRFCGTFSDTFHSRLHHERSEAMIYVRSWYNKITWTPDRLFGSNLTLISRVPMHIHGAVERG